MAAPVRKAVFPVAGLGTRFLPATKAMPKEMLTVVDRPLIQHVVDEAKAAGIEHFIFVTGRNKGVIEDHFDKQIELEQALAARGKHAEIDQLERDLPGPGQTSFTRQQEPLGLGHAVWCARELVGSEPFALLLPDVLVQSEGKGCLAQMLDVYARHGMVEKPKEGTAPSNLTILGRYILQPEIFNILSAQEAGAGGEIQITDAMLRLMQRQPFHALKYEGKSFDCGSKVGFLAANVAYALARPDLSEAFAAEIKKLL
jgi:UTP--glucose-1-phosphate uridylyltransferase